MENAIGESLSTVLKKTGERLPTPQGERGPGDHFLGGGGQVSPAKMAKAPPPAGALGGGHPPLPWGGGKIEKKSLTVKNVQH